MIRNATPGGSTASSPFSSAAPAATTTTTALTIPVKLPSGQIVNVGSQAEVDALRALLQSTQVVDLSRPTNSSSGTTSGFGQMLDVGADALQAVGGYLAGSQYQRLMLDMQQARADLMQAHDQLQSTSTGDPQTVNAILASQKAQLAYFDASISVLNAQITAVDMVAGGATAKLVSQFMENGFGGIGGGGGGLGTSLAFGAGGIGLGLLLANNSNNSSSSRRR